MFENGRYIRTTSGNFVPPTNTNDQLNSLAGRYNQNNQNQSSGNPLVDFFNSVIRPVGQAAVSTFGAPIAQLAGTIGSGGNAVEGKRNMDEFMKWNYGTNNAKDAYSKNLGAAIKTAGTAASFIPGAGAIAGNIAGGAAQGFGDEFYERGAQANLGTALGRAGTGALAEGLTAGAMNGVGSLANRAGSGLVGNLGKGVAKLTNPNTILGNVGRGALAGAVGGGTSAVGNTLAAGGSLEDALNSLGGGIGGGILAGGTMGGVLGIGSKGLRKIGSGIDNTRTKAVNSGAVDRLSRGIEQGADGNIKFTRLSKEALNDINSVRSAQGKQPLTQRQVTAYQNAINNHLSKHVGQYGSPEGVAQAGFEVLTSADSTALPAAGLNTIISNNFDNMYNSATIGLAQDGGTSLKSISPRSTDQINRLTQQRQSLLEDSGQNGKYPPVEGTLSNSLAENAQNVNGGRTSASSRLRQASAQKLLDQYGTIDKPMARSVDALDSVQRVSDAGFIKPADVERISLDLASGNGKVPRLTREIVSSANPVNIDGITAMVDDLIESQGLVDADAKSVRNIVNAQMNRINGGRQGSISSVADPNNVFDVMKALEKRSVDLKGKSGNNYRLTTPERADKAFVLDAIHDELEDRLYSGANVSAALTPEVRNDLISLAPNNAKWANYVDNTIMKSQDPGQLRSSIAPFVRMNRLIENQYMNYGTTGATMSRAQKGVANTLSKVPIVGGIAESIINSPASNRLQSRALGAVADLTNNAPVTGTTATPSAPASALVPDWLQAISRQSVARSQGQNAIANTATQQNSLIDQEMADAIAGYQTQGGNIKDLEIPGQVSEQSANNILNTLNSLTAQSAGMGQSGYGQATTAVEPTYTLPDGRQVGLAETEQAMTNAMMVGDTVAYERLASIYDMLNAAYERQIESSSPSQTKLSATQQRANAAELALDELAQMEPDFGYSVSNIPVLGGIVNLQGNNYESAARSLATQIGFMMSGANISEGEAFNIGKSYIPQPQDDEATRQAKLNRARNIIQQYQNTYVSE